MPVVMQEDMDNSTKPFNAMLCKKKTTSMDESTDQTVATEPN